MLVSVASIREIKGASHPEDSVPFLEPLHVGDAIAREYETDAHFFLYHVPGTDKWPRINKPCLPHLRGMGFDVALGVLAFDVDNPGHARWNNTSEVDSWISWFQQYSTGWLSQYRSVYSTRAGMRIVYELDVPIHAERAEAVMVEGMAILRSWGLAFDSGVWDWTRCFRLPRVVRDGHRSWESPFFREISHVRTVRSSDLPGADVPLGAVVSGVGPAPAGVRGYGGAPDPSEALESLSCVDTMTGRRSMSPWTKRAKARLKGRECFDAVFTDSSTPAPGDRDATLTRYAGQAVSMLRNVPDMTPDKVFALFVPMLGRLEPDGGTPDWYESMWAKITRFWDQDEAKSVQTKGARTPPASAYDAAERLASPRRPTPTGTDGSFDIQRVNPRLLIAAHSNLYYVMRPDGYYDTLAVGAQNLVAHIRSLGMGGVIETEKESMGEYVDVPATTIINKHTTQVREVVMVPNLPGGEIRSGASGRDLYMPAYRLNTNLSPEFNPKVDKWLRLMFGERFEEAVEWLAWSLAFDEGAICAISIEGDPGSGKKMLVRGLSECLEDPHVANAEDLVGQYQYGLVRTPFLVVNEGWPNIRHAAHPADAFRYIVDGEPLNINRRYSHPVTLRSPIRVIFTANNKSVVSMLARDRDLSPEDREALAVRIKHFRVGPEAASWFRANGGYVFTSRPGARWIAGDAGQASDYVVAKHLLHLYQQRGERVIGRRFLVDGHVDSTLMETFRREAGASPIVIETLLRMIESQNPNHRPLFDGQNIRVLTSDVLDYYRDNLAMTAAKRLDAKQIHDSLQALSCHNSDDIETHHIAGTKMKRTGVWWSIDARMLLHMAMVDGRRADNLADYINKIGGMGVGTSPTLYNSNGVLYRQTPGAAMPVPEISGVVPRIGNGRATP